MLQKLSKIARRIFLGILSPLGRSSRDQEEREERLEGMVGPPGVWKESREFQLSFLKSRGLAPEHRLLDLGCGPLRGGIPLIRYLDSGNYVGVDVRAEVVDEARNEIQREGLEGKDPIVIRSSSFGNDTLEDGSFDYVWCFQVLYHLTDDLADACLGQISRYLRADGKCYANVNAVGEEGSWLEFPYLRRPLEFYKALAHAHALEMINLGQQREWGYTTKVPGQFNHMLEFRKT